jgi:Zn-dependent protease
MTDSISITEGLLLYLILMASVCLHEWAHAVVADRLGDPTPRLDGRTTLNPAAHFDMVGTCIMPLVIIFLIPFFAPFGWGRRIILNPSNFRNPLQFQSYIFFLCRNLKIVNYFYHIM